jgi:hypothetical protein
MSAKRTPLGAPISAPVLMPFLSSALVWTSSSAPDEFQRHVDMLREIPRSTPHTVLARVLTAVAHDRAITGWLYLLEDPRRLALGDGDSEFTRTLIHAIEPRLSNEQLAELEESILQNTGRVVPWRRSVDGLRWRGRDQLFLLSSIPFERLTSRGQGILGQLRRKFPVAAPRERTDPGPGFVGSPIDSRALDRMRDADWLGAMAKYQGDTTNKDFLRGGAYQLAAELQVRAKANPTRFAALAMRMPLDLDRTYVDRLIRGLAEGGARSEEIFGIVRRFKSERGFASYPLDRSRIAKSSGGRCFHSL